MLLLSVLSEVAALTLALDRRYFSNELGGLLAMFTMSFSLVLTLTTTIAVLLLAVGQEGATFPDAVVRLYLLTTIAVIAEALVLTSMTAEGVALFSVSQEEAVFRSTDIPVAVVLLHLR
jgi:hypothetical protein